LGFSLVLVRVIFVDRFSLSITGDHEITRTNTNKRLTVIRVLTQSLRSVVFVELGE